MSSITDLEPDYMKPDQEPQEPKFTLRGQDIFSAALVRLWCDLAHLHGTPPEKIREARQIALQMDAWHTRKVPD